MDEKITKKEILAQIKSEWGALWRLLEPLSEELMTRPGVESHWSLKDILAHITDWDKRMVRWMEESLRGETPERPAPGMTWDDLDKLNAQTYEANKARPLEDVLEDFHRSYKAALAIVNSMDEEDLIDPERFAWREGDPIWKMVAANTWWHYKEHRETISHWLKDQPDT